MKKFSNKQYILQNLNHDICTTDWLMCIENFFGKEQLETFCEYFINSHHILRQNDIRNFISQHSMSIYSHTNNEQLAFFSIYKPIDTEDNLIKNLENGFEKAQKLYRNKIINLSKQIKKLGYSYSTIWCNWKDKNHSDTYQREQIFIIYSEASTQNIFKNNIIKLAKENNINSILITDKLETDSVNLKIKSKIYDVKSSKILKSSDDTTTEIIEQYLGNLTNSKVFLKIPYENNKKILYIDNKLPNYYSLEKQEKIKNTSPTSFNMAILKGSLLSNFSKENYNK